MFLNQYTEVAVCWWTLKITYGLLFIVAGADKFTNIIVHWQKYLSPLFAQQESIQHCLCMVLESSR